VDEARREKNRARDRAWRKANPEKHSARVNAWRRANRERVNAQAKTWRATNSEKRRAQVRKWHAANPGIVNAKKARRRARKLQATPPWADQALMRDMYEEAVYQRLTVDHIVPLGSPVVCGLHWEGNMQFLTAEENSRKGNRLYG
jgi:hypothetical protein